MSSAVQALAAEIASGKRPAPEIEALSYEDLSLLAPALESLSATEADYRAVLSNARFPDAFSGALSLGTALSLGETPSEAAIQAALDRDQPGHALKVYGILSPFQDGKLQVVGTQLAKLHPFADPRLSDLYGHFPGDATLAIENGKITRIQCAPVEDEWIAEATLYVNDLLARSAIGFSAPLPRNASHIVETDAQGRKRLERVSFVN